MILGGKKIVDGISVGQKAAYKNGAGAIRAGRGCFAISADGTVKQVSIMAAVTDMPVVYIFDSAAVLPGDHHLSGSVTPVAETVHLSVVDGSVSPTKLKNGEIAAVQPDEGGAWDCDVQMDATSTVYAWITPEISFDTISNAKISVTADGGTPVDPDDPDEPVDPDVPVEPPVEPKAYQISTSFEATPEIRNGATGFDFDMELSGPADLTGIELYARDDDTGEDAVMPIGVSGGDGSWMIGGSWERGGTPFTQFRVSGSTDDANGVIEQTVIRYEAVCLSGDTLITLADGTARRLDQLAVGDIVLGGNGRPARVLRLGRGAWNDRHTLYHFADGTTVDETHEHRFYNVDQGFWQKLKAWRIGDRARRQDGGEAALAAVERIMERAEMFGLWVERGSYWANGLLSGDASANLPLLADATAERAVDMAASLPERKIAWLMAAGEELKA